MEFELASLDEITMKIVNAGAVEVRDVDGGDEPFVYSSANRGPGYLMIKGLVGQPRVLKFLTMQLAHKLINADVEFDFINGNATGGMIPGWQLRDDVSELLGKEVPYCYLRGTRKEGGHGELITGDANNPLVQAGMKALIHEELVNFAQTTCNAAEEYRRAGYGVTDAATLLHYDNPQANERIEETELRLTALITLPELLDSSEELQLISTGAIADYRDFLADPLNWQLNRDYVVPTKTAEKAIERGYSMRKLNTKEAIHLGAPEGKLKEGYVYWVQV